jgi:hypothetical protein
MSEHINVGAVPGVKQKKTANSVDVGGGIRDEFAAFVEKTAIFVPRWMWNARISASGAAAATRAVRAPFRPGHP